MDYSFVLLFLLICHMLNKFKFVYRHYAVYTMQILIILLYCSGTCKWLISKKKNLLTEFLEMTQKFVTICIILLVYTAVLYEYSNINSLLFWNSFLFSFDLVFFLMAELEYKVKYYIHNVDDYHLNEHFVYRAHVYMMYM